MIDTLTNMYFSLLQLINKIFFIFIVGICIAFIVCKLVDRDDD